MQRTEEPFLILLVFALTFVLYLQSHPKHIISLKRTLFVGSMLCDEPPAPRPTESIAFFWCVSFLWDFHTVYFGQRPSNNKKGRRKVFGYWSEYISYRNSVSEMGIVRPAKQLYAPQNICISNKTVKVQCNAN